LIIMFVTFRMHISVPDRSGPSIHITSDVLIF